MKTHSILAAGLAALLFSALPAFADSYDSGNGNEQMLGEASTTKPTNIVQTAQAAGSFTTLVSLLESTGLDDTLSGTGPFTVFAPTDEAFAKVPKETLAALQSDPEQLKKVLTYHVVAGKVDASKVAKLSEAETVQGSKVRIDASSGVKVDDASVTKADIMASNGIIHVIDSVLIPES